MAVIPENENFNAVALVALTKVTGEFTLREMREKLMALGVPDPTAKYPLSRWARVATEAIKKGLLVKTTRFVRYRTGNTANDRTNKEYFYLRTDKTDFVLPESRRKEAEKILAAHVQA